MSTIAFFPEGAYGPTNNCVGIGDVLRGRGHRVVFIVEESFAGTLEAQGLRGAADAPRSAAGEPRRSPGQFWKDFIRETAPVFRKPTIEQLGEFIAPTFEALVDGARYVDERLREIIDELQPDVIVEDNVVSFPALPACGRPWVRISSCNPAEMKDPRRAADVLRLPGARPLGGGVLAGVPARARATCTRRSTSSAASAARRRCPAVEFMHESPWLNLYLYPGRGRLRARAAARADVAQPRGERALHRRGWELPTSCERRRRAALPVARLAGLGRRRADARLIDELAGARTA